MTRRAARAPRRARRLEAVLLAVLPWMSALGATIAPVTAPLPGTIAPGPPPSSSAPVSPAPASTPGDEAVYQFLLGKILRFDGDLDDAAAHLNRAAEAEDSSAIRVALAETYLRMGDVPRAVAEAKRARERSPGSVEARRTLVEAYLAAAFRGPDKSAAAAIAIDEIKSVLEQFPAENDLRMTLARLLLQENRSDEALDQLRTLRHSDGGDTLQAGVLLGRALLMAGREEEAETEFRSVLAASPDNPDSLTGLAQIAEGREDWSGATKAYEQLLQLRPTDDALRGRLGYVLMRAGRTDDAIRAFREASERSPSERGPRQMLVGALRAAGRPGEALHELEVLLEYHPQDPGLLLTKGQIHEERSENDLALEAYRRALSASESKVVPEETEPLADNVKQQLVLDIAGLEMETDDTSGALRTLSTVPRDDSKLGLAGAFLRVRALTAAHKGSAAVEEARRLAAQLPDDPRGPLLVLEARLVDASKREAEEAIAEFRPERRPPREVSAAAELLRSSGKAHLGLDLLSQALEVHPQEPALYFSAGALHERMGNQRRSEELLEKAIELDPKNGPALNYLGYMLADRGRDLPRAESLVRRALAEDPDNGAYLDSLGWALYREGKLDEAAETLERAVDLVAGDGTVREHLGDLYLARGDTAKALAAWKTAQSMKPEDPKRLREKILKTSRGEH